LGTTVTGSTITTNQNLVIASRIISYYEVGLSFSNQHKLIVYDYCNYSIHVYIHKYMYIIYIYYLHILFYSRSVYTYINVCCTY
jgi:hypothetical protein